MEDTIDKGLFSRFGSHYSGGRYSYTCTPCPPAGTYGYSSAGYPPPAGTYGYSSAGYPPPAGYPPVAYPYAGSSHHSGYGSSHMVVGGAVSAYEMQHQAHGGHQIAYGHHGYGHHGKFKHGKFHAKFKKWKR